MNDKLKHLLNHLAAMLDVRRQTEIEALYQRALRWEPVPRLPLLLTYPMPSEASFQPYPLSQVFDDPEKMLYNELAYAFNTSIACRDRIDDDLPLTVRANFGTVVMASLFGGRVEQVGENPPWVRHFETKKEFQAALDCDPFDYSRGWCPKVVERYQFYQNIFEGSPELARLVHRVLPDLQGPLDTAEQLRGSEIFVDFYNDPEMISEALATFAQSQIGFAKHLASYISDNADAFTYQHATGLCGRVLIRDDSTIMLSPAMYRDQVAPHDETVLNGLGGGGIHSCGKCQHNADAYLALPSIRCFDLGQPHLNDIDAIYAKSRQRRIALLRLTVTRDELVSGRVMERFPTGVSLIHHAENIADACTIMREYRISTSRRENTAGP
jgi:hypothetical protein